MAVLCVQVGEHPVGEQSVPLGVQQQADRRLWQLGLAPLHRERLVARGGRADSDPDVFLDTSSYGARAVDAVVREVGVDRLVHGSGRPVIAARELSLGAAVEIALRTRNPSRLLGTEAAE